MNNYQEIYFFLLESGDQMFPLTVSELLQPLLSHRLKEFIKWMLLPARGLLPCYCGRP